MRPTAPSLREKQMRVSHETVRVFGLVGTYRTRDGTIGIACDMGGVVVKRGDDGAHYPVANLKSFSADGGKAYKAWLRRQPVMA